MTRGIRGCLWVRVPCAVRVLSCLWVRESCAELSAVLCVGMYGSLTPGL